MPCASPSSSTRSPGIAALRKPPQLAENEAADRVVGVCVDRQFEPVIEQVRDRDMSANEPVSVRQAADGAGGRVGLVGDLADDLLDDVLDRDDSGGAAV